jgi:hypothetical protein
MIWLPVVGCAADCAWATDSISGMPLKLRTEHLSTLQTPPLIGKQDCCKPTHSSSLSEVENRVTWWP